MTVFNADQGTSFGTWTDPVSRFMYEGSMQLIMPVARLRGHVGDYGGANGLLREHYDGPVTTIDIDESKNPDVVDDILGHDGHYDTAWSRYVLHYLTDQEVIQFVDNVQADRFIIVQFVNNDLRTKYANSQNETKYFRTYDQTLALLPRGTKVLGAWNYKVTPEFYINRLGLPHGIGHDECLVCYEVPR